MNQSQLEKIRILAGLTRSELADLSGMSYDAVRALETGRRKKGWPETRKKISRALCLPERIIFGDKEKDRE